MQYLVTLIVTFLCSGSFAALNILKETETSQDRIATPDASKAQGYHYNYGEFKQQYSTATPSPPVLKPTPMPAPNHQHQFVGYNYQVPAVNYAAFSLGGTPLYQHSRKTPAFGVNLENDHDGQKTLENAATYYVAPAENNVAGAATHNNNGGVFFVPRANHQLPQENSGYKYEKTLAADSTKGQQTYKDSNVELFFNTALTPPLPMNYNYQSLALESQRINQNQEASLLNIAQNNKDLESKNFVTYNGGISSRQTGYNYQNPAFMSQTNEAETHANKFDSQFSSSSPIVARNQFGFNFNRANELAQQQNSYSIQENDAAKHLAPMTAATDQAFNKSQYKNIDPDSSLHAAAHFQRQISYNEYVQSQQQQQPISDISPQHAHGSYLQTQNDISASKLFNSPLSSNFHPSSQQQTENSGYTSGNPHRANPANPSTSATISSFRGKPAQTYGLPHTNGINNVASQSVGFSPATHAPGNTASHAKPSKYFEESPGSALGLSKPFVIDVSSTGLLLSGEQNKPYDYLQMQSQSYELPSSHYTVLSTAPEQSQQVQQQLSNNLLGIQQEQQQQQSSNSYLTPEHATEQQTSFATPLSQRQPHIIYGTPIAAAAPTASPSDAYLPPSSEFQLPYLK